MARARLGARSVEMLLATSRSAKGPAATSTVEMKFRNLRRLGGSDFGFDLEVRAGNATDIAIVNPFIPDNSLFEHEILSPGTCQMRGIRVSTDRPTFVFTSEGAIVASAQVDLASSRPRVIGAAAGTIHIR